MGHRDISSVGTDGREGREGREKRREWAGGEFLLYLLAVEETASCIACLYADI